MLFPAHMMTSVSALIEARFANLLFCGFSFHVPDRSGVPGACANADTANKIARPVIASMRPVVVGRPIGRDCSTSIAISGSPRLREGVSFGKRYCAELARTLRVSRPPQYARGQEQDPAQQFQNTFDRDPHNAEW